MEVVDRENVKVPKSVFVSGLTETELDEDVTNFLSKYGCIARIVKVDDPKSPYHKNAIAEYESGAAMSALELLLPDSYESPSEITYQIKALSSEYVPTVTGNAIQNFLSELQKKAKLSGRSFDEILQEHLSECSKSITAHAEPMIQPETESSDTDSEWISTTFSASVTSSLSC